MEPLPPTDGNVPAPPQAHGRGGTSLDDEASARLRPLADDVKAVLSVTRPDASAEASMGFLAGLVDR